MIKTIDELKETLKSEFKPLHMQLRIEIMDERIKGPVQAEAEIVLEPDESKGYVEVLIEELESEHIYAEHNGSIYGSFGIDQSIEIYDEVLDTIPFNVLIEKEDWKETAASYLSDEKLKEQIETVLNNFQFSDLTGKYHFRKRCKITGLNREQA